MKNNCIFWTKQLLFLSLLLLLAGCRKDELTEDPGAQPYNSFSMELNGHTWQPSQIGEDACMKTFNGAWSSVTENGVEKPYYTIFAYKDPESKATIKSENILKLQIFDVQKTGTYTLAGSYQQELNSFAVFTITKPDGTAIRYINKEKGASFVVEVSDFFPKPGSIVIGIEGSFYGTLYNENNPLDSITIREGDFTLRKVNWYNFNQCDPL